MTVRTPTELVLGALAEERFPALRESLAGAGIDGLARDAFVLDRAVVELLRDLRPDEGVGDGVDELVSFVHAAFLHWRDGGAAVALDRDSLDRVVTWEAPPLRHEPGGTRYVALPARRVWAEPVVGAPPEPLDGWYARRAGAGIELLAVFGLHPNRPGLTAAQLSGPRPGRLVRADGSAVFSPTVAGGREAGLWSLQGAEELLELAFRVEAWLGQAGPGPDGRLVVA